MSVIGLELDDRVAVITLAVPERRNALSRRLLEELGQALREAVDRDASAVVLTGAGPVFSAGADLAELTGTVEDVGVDDAVAGAVGSIRACPLAVVAAIEGACVGAAVDLALACDVRILAEDAYLAVPAVRLGILYNPEALARMSGRLGHETVSRLFLLGERILGEDAVTAGLASRAVPSGTALEAALALARPASGDDAEARAATKAVLGALAEGKFDAADWEETRRGMLDSGSRRERVRAARNRKP